MSFMNTNNNDPMTLPCTTSPERLALSQFRYGPLNLIFSRGRYHVSYMQSRRFIRPVTVTTTAIGNAIAFRFVWCDPRRDSNSRSEFRRIIGQSAYHTRVIIASLLPPYIGSNCDLI